MKTLGYAVGGENSRQLKIVLRDLAELHERLGNILSDCEVWVNEHHAGGEE